MKRLTLLLCLLTLTAPFASAAHKVSPATLKNPKIVASYINQGISGPLSNVRLFKPPTGDRDLRVSVTIQASIWADITLDWTNQRGPANYYYAVPQQSPTWGSFVTTMVVRNLTLLTFSCDDPGQGNTYDLFITVEAIQ